VCAVESVKAKCAYCGRNYKGDSCPGCGATEIEREQVWPWQLLMGITVEQIAKHATVDRPPPRLVVLDNTEVVRR
jgi:RNA polymerase subunit RPABC4/transcription elongation factor Spt4